MNKRELVESITGQVDASRQQVEAVLDRFIDTVGTALKNGDRIALTGFGAFEARQQAARTGQNPQTGEKMQVPARVVPRFKPGQGLKDAVAGGGSAKKSSAKKSSAKKSSAKKAGKKSAGKKSAAKKSAKKSAKKAGAKKSAPKKTAKKAAAKKSAKKSAPKKTVKKAGAKKSARRAAKKR